MSNNDGVDIQEILEVNSIWNNWRWHMSMRPSCSNVPYLIAIGIITDSLGIDEERLGLTPYNLKLLLKLKETDSQAFTAQLLQSLPVKGKGKKHQWAWAKRHDLFWSKFWELALVPNFLKVLFSGRGSDTDIKALENMYPETDVLIATAVCARNCSFCFREVGDSEGEASRTAGGMQLLQIAIQEIIERGKPNVLITGGDPLTRSNEQLRQIIEPLIHADTVKTIRLATRMVVDLPMRFYDQKLLQMLSDFSQQMKVRNAVLRIVIHVNHSCELTSEAKMAIRNIQGCGIDVLSQTVVLKGVNDDETILRELMCNLDQLGVRPYKLFQTMPVAETEHLRVSLSKYRKLVSSLHQWLAGTAVPQANIPTLVGKMHVSPSGRWMIPVPLTKYFLCRSYRGEWFLYRDSNDISRYLKEFSLACLFIFIIGFASFGEIIQLPSNDFEYTRVVYLDDLVEKIDYPEAWVREVKNPFVSGGVLYIPMSGFRS
jgi:lysine 2,3-aminomutase